MSGYALDNCLFEKKGRKKQLHHIIYNCSTFILIDTIYIYGFDGREQSFSSSHWHGIFNYYLISIFFLFTVNHVDENSMNGAK